jgi:hypothetical protein
MINKKLISLLKNKVVNATSENESSIFYSIFHQNLISYFKHFSSKIFIYYLKTNIKRKNFQSSLFSYKKNKQF